jgi:hypothetical protein
MKEAAKLKKLQRRISKWQANPRNGKHEHRCPGSRKQKP